MANTKVLSYINNKMSYIFFHYNLYIVVEVQDYGSGDLGFESNQGQDSCVIFTFLSTLHGYW